MGVSHHSQVAREALKTALTKVGLLLPTRVVQDAQIALNYVALGTWMKAHGFEITSTLPDRGAVFRSIHRFMGEPLLYLEFGVARGETMRHWSTALTHEDSVLIGFDSFEGLPEGFDDRLGYSIGAFDAHGEVPVIDDPRVSFVRGLFEETLPTFRVPPHTKLVINLDADLYSSSMAALRALSDYIVPGTVLFFDDFAHLEHEPRAFADFIATTGKEFDLLCTERNLSRPAFVCVDGSGNTHTRSRRDHAQPFGIVE